MKTVIGAGILALPFIFSTMGIVMTVALFLATGGLAYFMGVLLLNSKNLSGHSNYNTILYHIHPHPIAKVVTSTIMMFTPLGGCTPSPTQASSTSSSSSPPCEKSWWMCSGQNTLLSTSFTPAST